MEALRLNCDEFHQFYLIDFSSKILERKMVPMLLQSAGIEDLVLFHMIYPLFLVVERASAGLHDFYQFRDWYPLWDVLG